MKLVLGWSIFVVARVVVIEEKGWSVHYRSLLSLPLWGWELVFILKLCYYDPCTHVLGNENTSKNIIVVFGLGTSALHKQRRGCGTLDNHKGAIVSRFLWAKVTQHGRERGWVNRAVLAQCIAIKADTAKLSHLNSSQAVTSTVKLWLESDFPIHFLLHESATWVSYLSQL